MLLGETQKQRLNLQGSTAMAKEPVQMGTINNTLFAPMGKVLSFLITRPFL